MPQSSFEPIAVVGLSAMFPGQGTTIGFWQDICAGTDTLRDVPPTHWLIEDYYDPDPETADRTYGKRGGFLSPQLFDPVAMGIPPAALETTKCSPNMCHPGAVGTPCDWMQNGIRRKLHRSLDVSGGRRKKSASLQLTHTSRHCSMCDLQHVS